MSFRMKDDMALEVIGAGLGRTGTLSLKTALARGGLAAAGLIARLI